MQTALQSGAEAGLERHGGQDPTRLPACWAEATAATRCQKNGPDGRRSLSVFFNVPSAKDKFLLPQDYTH